MKKLFLLPAVLLGLVACGQQPAAGPGPSADIFDIPEGAFVIKSEDMTTIEKNNSYPKVDGGSFIKGGITFGFNKDVLRNSDVYNKGLDGEEKPGYGALNAFQFRKAKAGFWNTTAITGKTKVTVLWYATYDSEEAKYFPVIKQGLEVNDYTTTLTVNETGPLSGVAAEGYKTYSVKDEKESSYQIYKYKTTYNITASNGEFFSFNASNDAALTLHAIYME